jgi:hypothetical protein
MLQTCPDIDFGWKGNEKWKEAVPRRTENQGLVAKIAYTDGAPKYVPGAALVAVLSDRTNWPSSETATAETASL